MPGHCSSTFAQLARELGFSCRTEGGLVAFRNPFALENWTLPVRVCSVVYLAVMALFWGTALPGFLHATHGWARNGGPTGNLPYTLACFALAMLCAAAVLTTPRVRTATPPDGLPEVAAATS